jgi:uncharacterized protein with ParB-like and HNH nuclease domain
MTTGSVFMGYKSETIAATISHLNSNYFLPAIQREFVWTDEKITQLFDSLMRGYPISSFLYWELRPDNRDKWQVYRFVENASEEGTHNELANTDGVQQLTLVLDGQQRLTSLLIGLKGSYTAKKKYKKKASPDAWSKKRLYLDLLKDPRVEDQDDERGVRYGFAFRDSEPQNDGDHYWIKAGRILDFDNEDAFDEYRNSLEDHLPGGTTKDQIRLIRSNLERLHRAIWKEQPIAYHTELDQDYDRVLDIFVRANDGGVKLDKSDLLLSTVIAEWGDLDARDELHGFVDYINREMPRRNAFDTDFLMKACFVLSDLPVEYRIKNFNSQNLKIIRDKWDDIKQAILKGVRLATSFGIDGDTLISANALIPVIYYLYRQPRFTLGGTSTFDVQNVRAIKMWLTTALLTGAFGAHTDTTLSVARGELKALSQNDVFPFERLNGATRKGAKASAIGDDTLGDVLSLTYGKPRTSLALTLLYDDRMHGSDLHEDHIFPRQLFTRKNMTQRGFSSDKQARHAELVNRIGNLELLVQKENLQKSGSEFDKWISSRDESFLERHLIPRDKSLWNLENFEQFVAAREGLIRGKLASLFVATSAATETNGSEGVSCLTDGVLPVKGSIEDHGHFQADVPASRPSDVPDAAQAPAAEQLAVLRDRYMNHAATRTIIDHLGRRQRNQGATKLDALEAALRRDGTPLPIEEIKDVMKQLGNLGLGRFIISRHKKPTRFEWSEPVTLMALHSMATDQPAPTMLVRSDE